MGESAKVLPFLARTVGAPRRLEDCEDDELMLLTRGGTPAAFDTLVRRHQAVVLRVAHREVRDAALAKDVAQAAFLEIHRYAPRYQPQGLFKAFLYRVLLNQCRMAGRRRVAQNALMAGAEAVVELSNSPLDAVLQREQRKLVDDALARISPKLRAVVVLRYSADLSLGEIAHTLALPLGTVKSRLFAGMEELRHQLRRGET